MSPEHAAVVAGEFCGYGLRGMLLRSRGGRWTQRPRSWPKRGLGGSTRADGWPRQSTDVWLDRQPTEGVNPATQFFRPAEHLAVLSPGPNPQTPDAATPKEQMSTARTETRTSSWRTPTLRGLRQSLSVTRRTKQPVEEPLQLDANGLRKALAIGSDLIASPLVEHVRQQRAWDCGLACVLMAAPHARRQTKSEVKWNDVEKACGTRSVWTVDLAFALRALGCRDFLFLTKTTGCDPSYARLAFYRRDLGADSTRIQSLFRRAQQGEVSVKRAVATRDGLLEVLRTGRVLAIALVDLRLLHARAARTSLLPRSYTGHYVLLVGADGDRVRYRDPAADRAELVIDADDLHRARVAHGTDEDLILVAVDAVSEALPPIRGVR